MNDEAARFVTALMDTRLCLRCVATKSDIRSSDSPRSDTLLSCAMPTPEKNNDPICALCRERIKPGESAAGTRDRMLHLGCWLKERQEKRRAPGRREPS